MKGEEIKYDFNALRRDVMIALCLTKLSGRDFRVIIFILNQTDGYHRSQDKIKPAFFVERTGLDKSNIRVTIARLRKLNMIVKSGSFYMVLPPDQWDKSVFTKQQKRINIEALSKLRTGESNNSNKGISVTEKDVSAAEIVGAGKKRIKSDAPTASNPMRSEIKIDAVLASLYREPSIENLSIENNNAAFDVESGTLFRKYKKIISYYFKTYRKHKGKNHPDLKAEQWQRVINELEAFTAEYDVTDLQDFRVMIDYHFQRKLKTDYNINHFATEGILKNLYYKKIWNQ